MMFKKKIGIVLVLCFISIGLTGCGNNSEPKESEVYHLGESVETDIAKFTLNNSELAIALDRSTDNKYENYLLPKEYNNQLTASDSVIASTGYTLVYLDFNIEAISPRDNISICSINDNEFMSVLYNGKKFSDSQKNIPSCPTFGLVKRIKGNYDLNRWYEPDVTNIALSPGEEREYRAVAIIKKDIENLKDKYYITFHIPKSAGKTQNFTYVINEH